MKKIKTWALLLALSFLFISTSFLNTANFGIGILMGISGGITFFLLADLINRQIINRRIASIELKKGEQILIAEPSTFYKGVGGKQGKLFLTNKRVVFQEQSILSKTSVIFSFSRKELRQIDHYQRASLPTGLSFRLKNGEQYNFAIDDREQWKDLLQK